MGRVAGIGQEHGIHPLADEEVKQRLNPVVSGPAGGQHHLVAPLPGKGLDIQRQRRIKWIGDGGQDQPQHIGAAGHQAPRQQIGPIALLPAQLQDPLPGLRPDLGGVIQRPGHGGHGDARQPGDVFDGHLLHGSASCLRRFPEDTR